jgi:O-antigen/teichoic acid export membrane protein
VLLPIHFKGATDVGIYNAAIPISTLLAIPTLVFIYMFFPIVNKEYARGNKRTIKDLSQQVGKWILAINIPIFALIMLFPEEFLRIFFGEQYIGASTALRLLSIGAIFLAFSEVSNRLIGMSGKSKILLIDLAIVASINVILNILLVPKYGINGAALATMLSFILITLLFNYHSYKILSIIPLRRKVVNLLFASLLPAIIIYYLKSILPITTLSFILIALGYIILYLLLSFLFNGFDKNDLSVIKDLFHRSKLQKIMPNDRQI